METTIASFTYGEKPGDSTRSSYRPTGSSPAWKEPKELVGVVRVWFVPWLRRVTVAPAPALPVGPTTLRLIAPATLEVCATHEKASERTTAAARDNLAGRLLSNENMPALDRSEWMNQTCQS